MEGMVRLFGHLKSLKARGWRFLFFANMNQISQRNFTASQAISRPTGQTGIFHSISLENQLVKISKKERNY